MNDEQFFDYDYDLEDHSFLAALPNLPMRTTSWDAFSRPEEVLIDWHRTENQGPIGSCQGHSLSSCLERLAQVKGETIQLSEIFGYLATQKLDGLLGRDVGSTISGGCKVAMRYGCPPENMTGYPRRYPGRSDRNKILSKACYEAAKPYRALSLWQCPRDHEETLNFIGGGGTINFGIAWSRGLIPRDRIVREYRGGSGGGHAMCVLGYTKTGMLRAVNSHGDGEYWISGKAWYQMLSHRRTTAIGIMGNPEGEPIDWYKNSPYFQ